MRRTVLLRRFLPSLFCCLLAVGLLRCGVETEVNSARAPSPRDSARSEPGPTEEAGEVTAQWGPWGDLGATCASDRDCFSNLCVDGVCCDTSCDGACEACDVEGREGTCSVLVQGAACDDGNACTTADACDGENAGGCAGAPLRCDTPPSPCHESVGVCSAGACVYTPRPAGSSCGAGSVCNASAACVAGCWIGGAFYAPGAVNPAGPCQVCNPSASATAWSNLPATTVCRASSGACDVAETCTGAGAACPADARLPSGTVCRASSAACDVAETCDGTNVACPADALASAGTQCRGAANACDAAEYCTGSSATCPSDGRAPNGTVCGTSNTGSWGGCETDACGGPGTRYRSVTDYACSNGTCTASTRQDSQSCSVPEVSCPGPSYGGWGSCSATTCGSSGSRSRVVTEYSCSGGGCASNSYTDTQSCTGTTCPGTSYGSWSSCSADACGGPGSRSRSVTTYSCSGSGCVPSSSRETQDCSVPYVSCPGTSYGGWSACNVSACGAVGTRSRSVTSYYCSGGGCFPSSSTETQSCSGSACPPPAYGPWGACSASTCGGTGTQTRTVTIYDCNGSTCTSYSFPETQSCTASSGGCPGPVYGNWSACSVNDCGSWGTQSRSVTTYSCSGGSCAPSTSTETISCEGYWCPGNSQCTCGGYCLRPGEQCP